MSKGIFGGMFNVNKDGELNFIERAAEFNFIQHLMEEEKEEGRNTGLDPDDYDFD